MEIAGPWDGGNYGGGRCYKGAREENVCCIFYICGRIMTIGIP